MKLVMILLSFTILGACQSKPVAWEHGWKTDRVTATRYGGDVTGYNIGFDFPKDVNYADRVEVFDFMNAHGGAVIQGGGYPGATLYVAFKGVLDKASADKKLLEILPGLNKLMSDLAAGKKIAPSIKPVTKKEPVDDSCTNLGATASVNGQGAYKTVETRPGHCEWVIDTEAEAQMRHENMHREELWNALRTRVLTEKELLEVAGYGIGLNTAFDTSYDPKEKLVELNNALLIQQMLRQSHSKNTK